MRAAAPGVLLVLIMAQPNLATGMMPYYRHAWDLAPLLITVIFAAYLFALTPTLSFIGTPPSRAAWWWRIGLGSACGVGADLAMSLADSAGPACVARVLAGLSVGLVTGSLAGLILERSGEGGRTAMATATVLGSALGTIAAAWVAQYLPAPGVTVYLGHAALLGVVAFAVLLDRSPREHATAGPHRPALPSTEPRIAGYLNGIAAWVSAGLVVALLPSYGAELLDTTSLPLLALPVTLYLVSAWIVQRAVPPGRLPAEPLIGQLTIIAGVALAATVAAAPSLAVLLTGAVVAGCGQGIAYRTGLRIVSAATPPDRHARVASRYAAVAYLCAAVATLGFGVVATLGTMQDAVIAAALVLLAVAAATVLVRKRAVPHAITATPTEATSTTA
ncbi:MFS transporter [Nocardia colli]|uniref:MFS transporter n=1 Tax=Nocardia colli TaxID=2545717 RepID=A0A5N0EAI5_9NOCA|nr:MFS transporter [Nocardia colli]KAA8885966.1 MFS transporter [Nocardia colli]